MLQFITFMILSLILGFKHSYDSDHLIAVSNILRKAESVKSSMGMGISWVIGHMSTATIITILLYNFKETVLSIALPYFEKGIGVLIVILGILSLKEIFVFHSHVHSHGNVVHAHPHMHLKKYNYRKNEKAIHLHKHMLGIGIVQGFASNSELLLLFTSSLTITTLGTLLLGLGIFSIGVALGMILFAFIFSYPLIKLRSEKIYKIILLLTGSMSIIYGTLMIFTVI